MKVKLNLLEKIHCYHRLIRYCVRTEPDTASFINEFVSEGDVCLDIGAHKGVVTHMMRRRVGNAGKIIAFEPQEELFEWLEVMVPSLRLNNVELEQIALSEESGPRTLHRVGAMKSGSFVQEAGDYSDSVTVQTTTMDEYAKSKDIDTISFIKIDVDGFELQVLKGAKETLQAFRPVLLIEISDSDLADVSEFLTGMGYGSPEFEHRGKRYLGSHTYEVAHRHDKARFRNFLFQPV